jgi:hypothetical protein
MKVVCMGMNIMGMTAEHEQAKRKMQCPAPFWLA